MGTKDKKQLSSYYPTSNLSEEDIKDLKKAEEDHRLNS